MDFEDGKKQFLPSPSPQIKNKNVKKTEEKKRKCTQWKRGKLRMEKLQSHDQELHEAINIGNWEMYAYHTKLASKTNFTNECNSTWNRTFQETKKEKEIF